MLIQESGEMYLESIYRLSQEKGSVRAIDVSEYMGFSKPSVSRAMGILKEAGYVKTDENGYLQLTATGLSRAKKIFERHTVLTKFFERIGVSSETASEDACKIEHHISDESFEACKRFVQDETTRKNSGQ